MSSSDYATSGRGARVRGPTPHRHRRHRRPCRHPAASPGRRSPVSSGPFPSLKAYKFVSRGFQTTDSVVVVGGVAVGGGPVTVIAGPCAVESRDQLFSAAAAVQKAGARILRGDAFKPRTSPYAFQGLGEKGLQIARRGTRRSSGCRSSPRCWIRGHRSRFLLRRHHSHWCPQHGELHAPPRSDVNQSRSC